VRGHRLRGSLCSGGAHGVDPPAAGHGKAKDWRVHHLDVKSAFLNGKLAETIFVKQALGFAVKGAEHKVLRLRNAFYGLRQALRVWNTKLDATLGELEFTCCATEHALYTRRNAYLARRLLWLQSISEISCEMIIGATFFYGWYCRYSSLMLACFDTVNIACGEKLP
jgi:hypothetical protein